jgi:hypothetical protein
LCTFNPFTFPGEQKLSSVESWGALYSADKIMRELFSLLGFFLLFPRRDITILNKREEYLEGYEDKCDIV